MSVHEPVRGRGMLEMINRHTASAALTIRYFNSALGPTTNSRLGCDSSSGHQGRHRAAFYKNITSNSAYNLCFFS